MLQRATIVISTVGMTSLVQVSSLLAQDTGGQVAGTQPEQRSVFSAFFSSGDLLGDLVTWFLLTLSVVSISLTIMYALRARRAQIVPQELYDELEDLIENKKFREAIELVEAEESYLGKVAHNALTEAANGYNAMERAITETGEAETTRMLRPVELLNVLGNVAPMIGLFGTVYGMIVAFQKLAELGGQPDPAALAAGIGTALITTFWGLVVAIPAVAAYSLIRNKIDALTGEGMLMVEELITQFKPRRSKAASSSASSGAAASPRPRATPKPDDE